MKGAVVTNDRMVPAPPKLTCRRVTTVNEWQELSGCWSRLLAATPDGTPWQSCDHLMSWWRHLQERRELRIYVVSAAERPVLILPLQLTTAVSSGVPLRWLEPIGMLDDINRPRLGIGPADAQAYRCALDYLWRDHTEWDGVRIDEHPLQDLECDVLRDWAAGHHLIFRQVPFHPCPFLDIDRPWNDYIRERGVRLQKNLRSSRRKLESLGPVSLRAYESPVDIPEGLSVMLQIQSRSWKHTEGIGLSQSEAYRSYFRDFLSATATGDACRILVLFCGDQPVAATAAITAENVYYAAQIVHDEAFAAASPGTLLESMEMEDLFNRRRYRTYDFFGAALNNKLRWTNTARKTCRILVLKNSMKMRLLDTYWMRVKPVIHRIRNGAGAGEPENAGSRLPF